MTNKSIRDYINLIENAQQEGVAEGSDQYLIYISKNKVLEFEQWMESEGLETEVPKKDVGKFIVYDYSGQDVTTKSYADDWNEKPEQGVAEGISLDALGKFANIIPSFAQKLGAAAKQESKETWQMLQILKLKMQGKATPEQVQWMNKQWRDLAIIALGVGMVGYATAAGAAHGIAGAVGHGGKDALLHSLADIGLEQAAEVLASKFGIDIVKNLSHSLTTSTGQSIEHDQETAPQQYGVSPAVAAKNQRDLEQKFQQAKMGFGGMSESTGQYRVTLTLKDDSTGPGETSTRRVNVTVNAVDEQSAIAQAKQRLIKSPKYSGARIVGAKIQQGMVEAAGQLSIQQLATISDEALDKAYGYGRSTPGNTFGWQANLMSAAYAKKMIDAGITDIEKISDAIHKGWNVTAQKFVQNPDQFDDTEKLRQAGKLEAKLQQRAKLMKINYAQLDDEEQEKDRVVARALLQAIRGQHGVAGEQVEESTPDALAKIEDLFRK